MVIGFDIDNVIADFDKVVMEDISRSGIKLVNTNTPLYAKRFDWTPEQKEKYFADHVANLCAKLPVRKNVRLILNKLIAGGHSVVLISFRNKQKEFGDLTDVTIKWLEDKKIPYTSLIISTDANKTAECQKYNVDVFLDDRVDAVMEMRKNGVNAVAMKTRYNGEAVKQTQNAQSWLDFYNKLKIGAYQIPLQ